MNNKLSFAEKLVLAILQDQHKGLLNANRINSRIPKEAKLQTDIVYKALMRLCHLGLAEQPSKGQFRFKHPSVEITGYLEITRNKDGFVIPDATITPVTGDIFVPHEWLNHALPGDQVAVEVVSGGNRPKGRIISIVKRARRRYVGVLDVFEHNGYLILDKSPFNADVKIAGKLDNDMDGMKAVVEVYDFPERSANPLGQLVEVFGKPGTNDAEMHAIVAEFGFTVAFPPMVEKEAQEYLVAVKEEDLDNRRDFRDILTLTIDPEDAKDFDDAISLRILENGNYEIGVHIADVSHFVKQGSHLDHEALLRGTSVYLADRTIPMLPESLSNHLCSLKPGEDRLAFSAVFEMDSEAQVLSRWFGKSVIHSQRRFSYEEAQERIVTGEGDLAVELRLLNSIALKLTDARFKSGAISFETEEIRFKLDKNGKPLEVILKKRFEAHKLIEEFMLLANREVAFFVKEGHKPERPFIYRMHDQPSADRLIEFSKFCRLFGHAIDISTEKNLRKSLNKLLKDVEGKPEQDVLQQMALRSMAKAVYTAKRSDHFGLAFTHYTHFTSPIRRYPDLIVHRLLEHYLESNTTLISSEQIEEMAKHSSNMEQKAAEAERASTKYKMAEFLSEHIGKTFDAVVSGVTDWGIYAEIIENHCEGLIRLSEMGADRYDFIESEKKVRGRRSKRTYGIGDLVTIKVKAANPLTRQIDFRLVE